MPGPMSVSTTTRGPPTRSAASPTIPIVATTLTVSPSSGRSVWASTGPQPATKTTRAGRPRSLGTPKFLSKLLEAGEGDLVAHGLLHLDVHRRGDAIAELEPGVPLPLRYLLALPERQDERGVRLHLDEHQEPFIAVHLGEPAVHRLRHNGADAERVGGTALRRRQRRVHA